VSVDGEMGRAGRRLLGQRRKDEKMYWQADR